ncbi:MAG: Histidinol-phosphate aminotransferase, partial [uncultured Nocardioidaceae bacterium]
GQRRLAGVDRTSRSSRSSRTSRTSRVAAAAASRAARDRAVRRPAARRAGDPERQREPLPAVGGGGRGRLEGGRRGHPLPQPVPRPRLHRAARSAGGVPRPRAGRRAGLGRERLERGHAPAPPGLRRARPDGTVVRPHLLDVSRVRPGHQHRVARGPPRAGLLPRRGPRRRAGEGGAAECRAAPVAEQPDGNGAAARCGDRALRRRVGGRDGRGGRHRRGVRRVPPLGHTERPRAAGPHAEPGGDPDHEQSLRAGGRPARLH